MNTVLKNLLSLLVLSVTVLLLLIGCRKEETAAREIKKPVVTTDAITYFTFNSRCCIVSLISDGGDPDTEVGICYGLSPDTNTFKSQKADSFISGKYRCYLKYLNNCQKYYVRAYASNKAGTTYGKVFDFMPYWIDHEPHGYIVYLTSWSELTSNSASLMYFIQTESRISGRGICWNTKGSPSINDNHTFDTISRGGVFESTMEPLLPNTTYYVCAFGFQWSSYTYSNVIKFKTLPIGTPRIYTKAVSHVTQTSAISGGEIVFDGYQHIISKGICWSSIDTPTVNDQKVMMVSDTSFSVPNSFLCEINGLTPKTNYYLRAFVVNGYGTFYGNVAGFITSE